MGLESGTHLLGGHEAVVVRVELVEVLGEPRRVGLRFRAAHLAVAVGIEALPVLRTHRTVSGMQLVAREEPVVVRVDLVEALREAWRGRRLVAADPAVAVLVERLEAMAMAVAVAMGGAVCAQLLERDEAILVGV